MTARPKPWRDDTGAMLIFALIIITSVALVTGAVLSHGWTNLRATTTLRGVAATAYASDTAAKMAMNKLRWGAQGPADSYPDPVVAATYPEAEWVYTNNVDGTGCFGLTGTTARQRLILSNVQPKSGDQTANSSARVECTSVPGTGLFAGGAGVDVDSDYLGFKRAITTMGGDLTIVDNSVMQIRGGVASTNDIHVAGNSGLFTNGYVWANGTCGPGTITSTPEKECAHGSVDMPVVQDPLTEAEVAAMPYQRQAIGDCTFEPGYYDDATWLETRANACSPSPAVFAPGRYYFDFHNDPTDVMHNDLMTGDNLWNVDKLLIAGTRPAGNPIDIPGTCVSPIDDPAASGVRFFFGANSGISVERTAQVELCGSYSDTAPPVVLDQTETGSVPDKKSRTLTGSTLSIAGSNPAFSGSPTPADLAAEGGGVAQWSAPATGNPKAALKLGFAPIIGVPEGSMLKAAVLKVWHREVENATGPTMRPVNVKVTLGSESIDKDLSVQPTLSPEVMSDGGELARLLDDAFRDGTLATRPLSIDLTVSGAKKMDLTIDAVQLKVEYYHPTMRQAVEADYLLQEDESFTGKFVVQGATYAPKGRIKFMLGNQTDVAAFRYGLAAREIELDGHPQVPYGYPLVSIPDVGMGLGRRVAVVDLKVHVCVETSSCTSGGTHALTVRVKITDPPYGLGGRPTPGQRRIEVLSWARQ